MKRLLVMAACLPPFALMAQITQPVHIGLHNWATGLSSPVIATNCGDDRMFVVEQGGTIRIVSDSMTVVPTPFLNITSEVNSSGNEQGLLSLAFDPGYLENGYFYVYYINGSGAGTSRISRFSVTADPNVADPTSEQVLYTWPQPFTNHNGGCLRFGADGYLYCGFGDGGSGDDPNNNGQTLSNPLGDMIRIDVSEHNETYAIPATNPYVNATDTLPEIWANGLRNPWRYSFDRLTGDLWIGDVGQNAWEEVDHWVAGDNSGPNFGWRCREGLVATPGVSQTGCQGAAAYVSPLAVFNHTSQGWCAIIGGYVYRAAAYPHLYGKYFFTDYCAGDFLTLDADVAGNPLDTVLMSTTTGYSGFGEDAAGNLYVVNVDNGQMKKIYDACPMDAPIVTADGYVLSSTAATTYQWYVNGTVIPGATAQMYTALEDGDYAVVAGFGSPCSLTSEPVTIVGTGIDEFSTNGMRVYPQPATDMLTIQRKATGAGPVQVDLLDATGRMVRTATWLGDRTQLSMDVSDLSGVFVLRVLNGGKAPLSHSVLIAH